jgi:uncharacterized protein YndB with AHSA1/START domain
VGDYTFTVHVDAPPEVAFALWTDLDRMSEWIEGITRVTDVSGPPDQAGSTFTVWFGRMASPTRVLAAERPRRIRSRFGNRMLRGEMEATFEPAAGGTALTQRFRTEGLIPAISARVFATGSWRGSFKGELATFARLAAEESARRTATTASEGAPTSD